MASRCPKSKRGHSWGGRAAVLTSRVDADNRLTCSACGAPGIVDKQGRMVEVKP